MIEKIKAEIDKLNFEFRKKVLSNHGNHDLNYAALRECDMSVGKAVVEALISELGFDYEDQLKEGLLLYLNDLQMSQRVKQMEKTR